MPGVWNVNNGYAINNKKISSKLTFEVGESFTGRVVSKGEKNDITIKLADGWQFIAELDGNVNLDDIKLVKFQVNGFENGKLKLKIIDSSANENVTGDESFQEIIEREGLSKDDINILKQMVKHNLSLTRDNITAIKGLIQFNDKLNNDPKEIESFINTYLQSKNIDANSSQGQVIKEMLTKFLNEFKEMNQDDILTFIENNLDFSGENIQSFNKLFKDGESIENILQKMNKSMENIDIPNNDFDEIIKDKFISKIDFQEKSSTDTSSALASKVYNENDPSSKKINVLDVLKTLAGNEETNFDVSTKSQNNVNGEINNLKVELPSSLIEKLNNEDSFKLIKEEINSNIKLNNNEAKTQAEKLIESSNKNKLELLLSNIEGNEVKFTDKEYKEFNRIFYNKLNGIKTEIENLNTNKQIYDNKEMGMITDSLKDSSTSKENFIKSFSENIFLKSNIINGDSTEEIQNQIKSKIDNVRDIVKNLLNHMDLKNASYEKVIDLIKNNINDIKMFNSISNEYYYLNIPINMNNNEYPCKFIIKDNRKDGKKIDKTNTKMIVSVKTINLGEIDGYLTLRDNKIDINLKCEDSFTSIVNNNKYRLIDGLKAMGMIANVNVVNKEKTLDIGNCSDFFNDLTISAIDIRV